MIVPIDVRSVRCEKRDKMEDLLRVENSTDELTVQYDNAEIDEVKLEFDSSLLSKISLKNEMAGLRKYKQQKRK